MYRTQIISLLIIVVPLNFGSFISVCNNTPTFENDRLGAHFIII